MKIPMEIVKTVEAKYVRFHAKMRDEGTYNLLDEDFNLLGKEREGYVPSFFPYGQDGNENHFGDYIDLWIDLETGQVVNWKKNIHPEEVARAFGLLKGEEES